MAQAHMNLPNLLSLLRIVLAPLMLWLAWRGEREAFIAMLLLAWLSDAVDGWLARRLKQITELGARLDSWGDLALYLSLALGAWWLWPERIRTEALAVAIILAAYFLPVCVGLIKFRHLTSYHTWAVKAAAVTTALAVIALLLLDVGWPLRAAAAVSLYAAVEEIAITLRLQRLRSDIASYWHLSRDERSEG